MKLFRKKFIPVVMSMVMLLGAFLPQMGTLAAEGVDEMVVTSPWAYYKGTMDNSQTYAEGGYQYTTLVKGENATYSGALMRDADMSIYSSFRFAVKTNGNYYYEVGKVSDSNYNMFSGNETTWTEYTFTYEDDGQGNKGFRMKKNGTWTANLLPEDMNLSDLQMKFSSNTNAVLYMTEVRGILRDSPVIYMTPIADSFYVGEASDVSIELPNRAATKNTQATTSWVNASTTLPSPLADVALADYIKVLFYARQTDETTKSGWFESTSMGKSFQITKSWTEFKLVKTSSETWDIYIGGVRTKNGVTLTNLSELSTYYGSNDYYFSQVFGVSTTPVTLPEEPSVPTDEMVVTSPWAYYKGTMDNSQTYAEGGYQYATLVNGENATYSGALMRDADMSIYSSFRFAVKTNGNYWYEAGKASEDSYGMLVGNETTWTEYTFTYEDDGQGNKGFRMKKNGTWTANLLPEDMNLSDLQMKFSSNTSAVLYMTEVRGTLKDGAAHSLKVVADNFNGKTGTENTVELPNAVATKSTEVQTTWGGVEAGLTPVDLSGYNKILFYAKRTANGNATGYFESALLGGGGFVVDQNWTEFKLVKNADGTWNLYTGGVLKSENQTLSNLSDVTAKYGTQSYYFSQVFGVESQNILANAVGLVRIKKAMAVYQADHSSYDEKADFLRDGVINRQDVTWIYQNILGKAHEYMVVTSPWAYYKGTMDNSQTYTEGGYQYATLVNGENAAYSGALMRDADMSIYSEFRFAVKTNGDYWYEAGKASEGSYGMLVGNETTWTEYTFTYEDGGVGNTGFRMKKNGNWTANLLPEDMNLSDLQMKFSANTNAVLYMTEVRGTVKDGSTLPLQVVADSFNLKTGTMNDTELPNISALKSTEASTTWAATEDGLTSVDLSGYNKILFYAKRTASGNANGYFESALLGGGGFVVAQNWTEFKLVKNAGGTWNLYTGGVLKSENQTLSNLSDVTAKYGKQSYYFSEVFAVSEPEPIVLLDESGQAQYSVAYKGSGSKFAADEFAAYMNQATAATFTSAAVTAAPKNDEKTIAVGLDLASEAGLRTVGLTTDNGYAIKQKGNTVYVYGKTEQGTLNGVYALLDEAIGLEIYYDSATDAEDCYTETYESGAISLENIDTVFNPGIDYLYDLNGETRGNAAYRKKLGYTLDYEVLGGSAHAETDFIANTSYYTGTLSNGHMVLDEKTAKEAAKWLYDCHVKKQTNKEKFLFGLADNATWYDNTTAGQARTNQYITFVNQMAAELSSLLTQEGTGRTISLILMAYNNTIMSPSVALAPKSNVKMDVMYAPVQANWYKPLTDAVNDQVQVRNANNGAELFTYDADAEFGDWADVANNAGGEIMLWSYHTFFDSYLTPLDCIDSMYYNYQLASSKGVTGVYENVQYDNAVATDWNRLKVYLRSALVENPNMLKTEYEQLIENFMNAYFGEAAQTMKEVLSTERALIQNTVYPETSNNETFGLNYGCGKSAYMVTSKGNYKRWDLERSGNIISGYTYSGTIKTEIYEKMQSAYDSISDNVIKERIKLEMLAIRYVLLSVPQETDRSNADTFASLTSDCQALGLTYIKEGTALSENALKTMCGQL